MKKVNTYIKPVLYLGWVLFFIAIWFKGCDSEKPNTHKITIPEVKGKFEPAKVIEHNKIDSIYLDKIIKVQDPKLISDINKLYNENEQLKKDYIDSDSLKRELMYLKSIQLSEFYHEFNNDTIKILVKGIVQGEVKQLQPFYTIKERQVIVPEVKFRLLAGGSIGNTTDFNNPLFSAGLGFQNKKGNILLGSFDTEKRISIGYYQSIFTLKKP
jgi:hypothetical protein